MSLETLLEAAEFLESRGKGNDSNDQRYVNRRTKRVSEPGSSHDETDNNDDQEFTFKEPKSRSRHGKTSPIYVGSPDGFFMRAGTREVHNKLEKNRRAHLKECFDFLKKTIPSLEDKRTSNLGILRSSLRYIQNLKRREREYESDMQKFAQEKILLEERMQSLKGELNQMDIGLDLNAWVTNQERDNETNSTSTATERGTPPPSDHDEDDDDEEEAERLAMETNPSPTPKRQRKSSTSRESQNLHILPKSSSKPTFQSNLNGLLAKQFPSATLKSPVKKSIPITLSLSGPVQLSHPLQQQQQQQLQSQQHIPLSMMAPGTQPVTYLANVAVTKATDVPLTRTPVTQILHRTLTQRQAMMKLSALSAMSTQLSASPSSTVQLPTTTSLRPQSSVTMTTTTQSPLVTKDGIGLPTTPLNGTFLHLAQPNVNNQLSQNKTASGAMPLSFPCYMTSLQKMSHPILVTSLMSPAIGMTNPITASNSAPQTSLATYPIKTEATAQSPSVTMGTNFNFITTPLLTTTPVSRSEGSAAPSMFQTIRPIFAPNLLQGQVAWPFMTAMPRSSVVATGTSTTQHAPVAVSSATTQVTSVPVISIAQLNQLTQMMTPMTVVSPGIQVAPTQLTQTQLNTMFASPLLKQYQMPVGISPSFIQSGQLLGQQVVKPVIMVTMPETVVGQTQSITAKNNTIVTKST